MQFEDAEKAMQQGDWEKFGKAMDALKRQLVGPGCAVKLLVCSEPALAIACGVVHAAPSDRALKGSSLARPYILRLANIALVICPTVGAFDHGWQTSCATHHRSGRFREEILLCSIVASATRQK